MADSIFNNFDPEDMHSHNCENTPFGHAPFLYFMIAEAITACGTMQKLDGVDNFHDLTNDEFVTLSEDFHNMARKGFERNTLHTEDAVAEFGDCTLIMWARHEKESRPGTGPTLAQMHALYALWIIDNAMTAATDDGITANSIEAIAAAALYLSEARVDLAHDPLRLSKKKLTYAMSALGKLGADAAHVENRALKKEAFAWCDANMKNFPSMDSAAGALQKVVPVAFRTARSWVGDWKKQLPPAGTL
jgi:hypothetical protein